MKGLGTPAVAQIKIEEAAAEKGVGRKEERRRRRRRYVSWKLAMHGGADIWGAGGSEEGEEGGTDTQTDELFDILKVCKLSSHDSLKFQRKISK